MVFALPKALRKVPRQHSDEPIIVINPKIAIFIFIGDPSAERWIPRKTAKNRSFLRVESEIFTIFCWQIVWGEIKALQFERKIVGLIVLGEIIQVLLEQFVLNQSSGKTICLNLRQGLRASFERRRRWIKSIAAFVTLFVSRALEKGAKTGQAGPFQIFLGECKSLIVQVSPFE